MMRCKGKPTKGGFRLIRAFSTEHNVRRLKHYVKRLGTTPDAKRWGRRWKLRHRFGSKDQRRAAAGLV